MRCQWGQTRLCHLVFGRELFRVVPLMEVSYDVSRGFSVGIPVVVVPDYPPKEVEVSFHDHES